MKDRLKEAYIANYKAKIDEKAQAYLEKAEKLETYVQSCIDDFRAKCEKGKHIVVCAQRPKVDDLYANLVKFDTAFSKMCENTKEYRGEFQLSINQKQDYPINLRELLNHHVQVSFPGLERGFFYGLNANTQFLKPKVVKVL